MLAFHPWHDSNADRSALVGRRHRPFSPLADSLEPAHRHAGPDVLVVDESRENRSAHRRRPRPLEGLENIPPAPCIFAANHVSYVDPLAFVPRIPRRVSVALKKELYRIPILGYGMLLAKFVSVDRESREGAVDSLKTSVRYLKEGLSFAVYPEGTRSPDGRLRPFKKGAFVLAIQAGVPIVPVSISGAQKLMRKGEWAIRPGEVLIRFGSPVDAAHIPSPSAAC